MPRRTRWRTGAGKGYSPVSLGGGRPNQHTRHAARIHTQTPRRHCRNAHTPHTVCTYVPSAHDACKPTKLRGMCVRGARSDENATADARKPLLESALSRSDPPLAQALALLCAVALSQQSCLLPTHNPRAEAQEAQQRGELEEPQLSSSPAQQPPAPLTPSAMNKALRLTH